MTSHTKKWKEAQLSELRSLVSKYKVIAVADINMFPAALFQGVRKKLKGKAVVKVSKTRVLRKALGEHPAAKAIVEHTRENCAIIFTDMNPFELFSLLKKGKGKIPAKVGAIAEEDIIVPAGDTGLPPGPALSDLKAAGLKVAVQGATISVMADKVVTKAGEPVTVPVAATLSKLNIKPFKVGLNMVAALEGGHVFMAEVLDIDTDRVFAQFVSAHGKAFNLAFNAAIVNSSTADILLAKAFSNAKAVALEANFLTSATVGGSLAKANAQALALKGKVKDAPEKKEAPEGKAKAGEQGGKEEQPRVGPVEKKGDA